MWQNKKKKLKMTEGSQLQNSDWRNVKMSRADTQLEYICEIVHQVQTGQKNKIGRVLSRLKFMFIS